MKNFFAAVAVFAVIMTVAFAQAFGDDSLDLLFDAGANPSLCNCACECQRPKGADLLREKGAHGDVSVADILPIKVEPVA